MAGPVKISRPVLEELLARASVFQPVENAVAHDDQQQTPGDCPPGRGVLLECPQRRLYFRQASGRGGTPHSVRHPLQFELLVRILSPIVACCCEAIVGSSDGNEERREQQALPDELSMSSNVSVNL